MRRFARPGCFAILCVAALALCPVRAGAAKAKPDKPIVGEGLIDRVISNGAEPVFRADGYLFRISAKTELRFPKRLTVPSDTSSQVWIHPGKGLSALSEVGVNVWARFEGLPDATGTIVASKAQFLRLESHKSKPDPTTVQITSIPAGSSIDAYKGVSTGAVTFPPDDEGGWCGWYPLPADEQLQEHVLEVGLRVVPQSQRALADNDPARIPFRFYAVEGTGRRTEIFCPNGLVLLPMAAMRRIHGDDQLAAVLAEGVAGEMGAGVSHSMTVKNALEVAPLLAPLSETGLGAAIGDGAAMGFGIEEARRMEHSRARMALALMADAGYDPHQAAEAWRLLRPIDPPKDPTKVKDSEHSRYIREFLAAQEAAKTPNAPAQGAGEAATTVPDTKAKQ